MRILIHDYCGHPFQVQLSRYLAKQGYEVLHTYSSSFQTPRGQLLKQSDDPATFNIQGIDLGEPFHKYSLFKRRFQEVKYGRELALLVKETAPNIVISANTPIEAQALLARECRRHNTGFIFWVQDIYSVAVHRLLKRKHPILGTLVGRYYMAIERRVLKRSDHIVTITEDFTPILQNWTVPREHITVIPNWAPLDEVKPVNKINSWSTAYGVADKFCFLYSGTLGLKHNPGLLLQLALHFRERTDVRIVVISEGLGADLLKKGKEEHQLDNLIILDFQPYEELSKVLSIGDVLMAILEPDAGVFSVPSKVLTYMCIGKPLLLAVPHKNLAARIVSDNLMGYQVNPDDVDDFIAKAKHLVEDSSTCTEFGQNALNYAQIHFRIEHIGRAFEEIIHDQVVRT